jgi:hypothetical protein
MLLNDWRKSNLQLLSFRSLVAITELVECVEEATNSKKCESMVKGIGAKVCPRASDLAQTRGERSVRRPCLSRKKALDGHMRVFISSGSVRQIHA